MTSKIARRAFVTAVLGGALSAGCHGGPPDGEIEEEVAAEEGVEPLDAPGCNLKRVTRFRAVLGGAEEVPPRTTPATGFAAFALNRGRWGIDYVVSVENIRNVTAAHIHIGLPTRNGPVAVLLAGPFLPGGGPVRGVLAEGTITVGDLMGPLEEQRLDRLLDQMRIGNTYVNVHTDDGVDPPNTGPGDFPAGEIRGQIDPLCH